MAYELPTNFVNIIRCSRPTLQLVCVTPPISVPVDSSFLVTIAITAIEIDVYAQCTVRSPAQE